MSDLTKYTLAFYNNDNEHIFKLNNPNIIINGISECSYIIKDLDIITYPSTEITIEGFDLGGYGLTQAEQFISGTVLNVNEVIKDTNILNIRAFDQTKELTINYNFYPRPEISGVKIADETLNYSSETLAHTITRIYKTRYNSKY